MKMNSNSEAKGKRLIFDRRYGWVIDDAWKEPSQQALAAGRGMFCLVPLAMGFVDMASHSINVLADGAVKLMEGREELSPQKLQATIGHQNRQQLTTVSLKPNSSSLTFKGKQSKHALLQK